MIDHITLNQVCSFLLAAIAFSQGSIIGSKNNLKLYYSEIRIRAFLFGFSLNQREIAENYLQKLILTA